MSIVNSVKGFVRTVSGIPPLTLPDCVDTESVINYTISGNGVGDYDESTGKHKIPVVCSGKNLFDYKRFCAEYNPYVNNDNGKAIPNDTFLGEKCFSIPVYNYTNFKYLNNYSFKENTSYTFNCEIAMSYGNRESLLMSSILIFYTDGTYTSIRTTVYNNQFIRGTAITDANKTVDYVRMNSIATSCRVYIKNMQIEESTTATDYEPYVEPVTTNIYLDEPLAEGETLKNPIKLPTFKGTTIYSIDTEVQPSNMEATYYSTSKE